MAHFKSFGVLQMREKRLDAVSFLGGYDYDIGVAFESGKSLQFFELRPISDIGVEIAQVERQWPGVFARQGDGNEVCGFVKTCIRN